jgi:small conductance mechanosensitive channel
MVSLGLYSLFLVPLFTEPFDQAIAQKTSETASANDAVKEMAAQKVGADANELLLRINAGVEDLQRYTDEIKSASEEDRLVIKLQIFLAQQRFLEDLQLLSDALLEQEKKDKQPELRRQVEALLSRVPPDLWFHINRLRDEIDAVRGGRTKAAANERPAIEAKVAKLTKRLDRMYEMSLEHVEKMAQVGLETKKVRGELIQSLTDRAEELSGRITLATGRIADLEALREKLPNDTDVFKLLVASVKNLDTNTSSMEAMLALMEKLELDTTVYRTQLVETTSELGVGVIGTGAIVDLARRALEKLKSWLVDDGPKLFFKLILIVGILYVFLFARRLVRAGLEKAIEASNLNLSQLAHRMIVSTVSNLVLIFGLLIALSQMGIRLGPLLAGLGIAGFIVGFALQDTLSNFASGIMILLYRPYDVGDLIDVAGVFGTVNKMSLVSTSISTLDNQMIVVPNNKIWGDVIKNVTAQNRRRVDMVFGIAYNDDINKAEEILNDILKSHDKILDHPEPMVRLHTLGESSVDFVVRPWVNVDDYWDVYWDVTKTVKLRFDQEGISIPFPQRDVHVYNDSVNNAS